MPQSEKNVNVSIARTTHSMLLDIRKRAQDEVKEKKGLEVNYSLNAVITMLAKQYLKS